MTLLRKIFVAVLVASLGALSCVVLTACADEEDEQVELSVTERDLSPQRVEVEPGEVEFVVKNDGKRLHAFAVETADGIERTKDIKPGDTARVTVDLSEGRYRMYDPRGDYRELGVRGTVVVEDDDTDTVTERTVTERTVEEEPAQPPPEPDEPPVTVTERERQIQPPPRNRRPTPTPAPTPSPPPPPPPPNEVPVEPPPPDNP